MKQKAILVVTSLLSILLLTLHIADDIVRGISKTEPQTLRCSSSRSSCTGRWCLPNGGSALSPNYVLTDRF
jgi:hypothetical protein